MELKWWWIVVVGLLVLAVVVTVAFLWPLQTQPRSLRPLAWVHRLTQLPEYVSAYRRYRILLAAIAVTTVAVLLCAIVATARPVNSQATGAEINRAHPEDVMLCVVGTLDGHASSVLFGYFRDQAGTFDTQRLGVTHGPLRIIPLTRDYPYLQDELGTLAGLEGLFAKQNPTPEEKAEQQRLAGEWGKSVSYSDYKFNVNDALAMCIKGFPGVGKPSDSRRSVIYLGPATSAPDAKPIFSDGALTQLATSSGIQLNVLTKSTRDSSGALSAIAENTGGRFITYVAPADAKDGAQQDSMDNSLRRNLNEIRSNPPALRNSDGTILVEQVRDRPNVALTIGLAIVILFSISLAGVRR